jgi:hypothetical protein
MEQRGHAFVSRETAGTLCHSDCRICGSGVWPLAPLMLSAFWKLWTLCCCSIDCA